MTMPEDPRIEGIELLKAPELGAARLRALQRRILAAAEGWLDERRRAGSWWDVLAAWARPGLAAAAIAALILLALRAGAPAPPAPAAQLVPVEQALQANGDRSGVPAWLVSVNTTDTDALLHAAILTASDDSWQMER